MAHAATKYACGMADGAGNPDLTRLIYWVKKTFYRAGLVENVEIF